MKKEIILFCNYTSFETRDQLHLSNLKFENLIRRICHLPLMSYRDAAQWVRSFIDYFAQSDKYELHIVCLQQGMKYESESFDMNSVHFHYIKSGLSLIGKLSDKLFRTQKRQFYPVYRKRYAKALSGITPSLIMMCGAENPDYAAPFLEHPCKNKLVIMQTWMNDPKRMQMGVSTAYRREIENKVLKTCNYFAIFDRLWVDYVKSVNPEAKCFDFVFPTVAPIIDTYPDKEFDFAFFAGILGKYKGVDDTIEAMVKVKQTHPSATLNIIGGASADYMDKIKDRITELNLWDNITMTPSFPIRNDVFNQVLKSRNVVLPSITASLNSTVREAMLLALPTIVYRTWATEEINMDGQALLEVNMEDKIDLAQKMEYALDNPDAMNRMALRGKSYAEKHFTSLAFYQNMDNILASTII